MSKISVLLANLTVPPLDSRSTSFLFSSSIVIWGPQPAVPLRNTQKKYLFSIPFKLPHPLWIKETLPHTHNWIYTIAMRPCTTVLRLGTYLSLPEANYTVPINISFLCYYAFSYNTIIYWANEANEAWRKWSHVFRHFVSWSQFLCLSMIFGVLLFFVLFWGTVSWQLKNSVTCNN